MLPECGYLRINFNKTQNEEINFNRLKIIILCNSAIILNEKGQIVQERR